jgi:hypothetical protein
MSLAPNSSAGSHRDNDPRVIIDSTSDSETGRGDDSDSDGGIFMGAVNSAIREAQRSPQPTPHQLINLVDSPSPASTRPPSNRPLLHRPPSNPQGSGAGAKHILQPEDVVGAMAGDGENEEHAIKIHPADGPSPQRNAHHRNFQYDVMEDYVLEEDLDDNMIARLSDQNEMNELAFFPSGSDIAARQRDFQNEEATALESRDDCISSVAHLFPGICLDYVATLYDTESVASDRLIAYILDKVEKGTAWPKAKDNEKHKKRKRELGQDEQAALRYGAADRIMGVAGPPTKGIRGFM